MTISQPPIIVRGDDHWWVVTDYHANPGGEIQIEEKWDVTDRIEGIMETAIMGAIHPAGRQN